MVIALTSCTAIRPHNVRARQFHVAIDRADRSLEQRAVGPASAEADLDPPPCPGPHLRAFGIGH
jgi:hypothetical protein